MYILLEASVASAEPERTEVDKPQIRYEKPDSSRSDDEKSIAGKSDSSSHTSMATNYSEREDEKRAAERARHASTSESSSSSESETEESDSEKEEERTKTPEPLTPKSPH